MVVTANVKRAAVVSQVLLTSSIALLTHATKTGGDYSYNTLTVQLFAELLKLLTSAMLFSWEVVFAKEAPKVTMDWSRLGKASIPALLYFVSNNLNFIIIRELDPVAFQILNNLKILTTAILYKFMMNAELSPLQWRMLLVLTGSSILSQFGGCGTAGGSTLGYGLKLLNCMITASATVYNEKFMKANDDSIHFQNMQLYLFGFLFGTSVTVNSLGWDALNFRVLTAGYTPTVVLLVINYAFAGIATSAVLKYLDNMTKTFAANAAMFVVALIAILYYDEKPTVQLFVGMIMAAIAVDLYQLNPGFEPKSSSPKKGGAKGREELERMNDDNRERLEKLNPKGDSQA